MSKRRLIASALIVLSVAFLLLSERAHFLIGGVFINLGYRFQDHVDHLHEESTDVGLHVLLEDLIKKNQRASFVRRIFPRSEQHPKVALLACMDARIDTVELMGDTRRSYYTLRTAGSVLEPLQQEMLEIAVNNGIGIVLLTTHTDCSAEKIAKSGDAKRFPNLTRGIDHRHQSILDFLKRENIQKKIVEGDLIVVEARIKTQDGGIEIVKIYDEKSILEEI